MKHALVVIIAQPFRDVGMEQFVDDYISVDKFKKAYARRMEQLADRIFWPQVEIALDVGSPLGKRAVGRQRKNRIKGCLEGGSGKKASAKDTDKPKTKTLLRGQFKCPNYHELGHRKNSLKCLLNGIKKRQFIFFMCTNFDTIASITVLIYFLMCRKRKQKQQQKDGSPRKLVIHHLQKMLLVLYHLQKTSLVLHRLRKTSLVLHRLQECSKKMLGR
jgi:hypothetical protein